MGASWSSCQSNPCYMLKNLKRSGWLLMLLSSGLSLQAQSLNEGFETGLPATAPTSPTNYTLSSGTWTLLQGAASTVVHSGSVALQLAAGSASVPTYAGAPSVSSVSTVTLWARGSAKGKLKVQKSVNGGSFSDITTLNIGTGYSSFSVSVNESSLDVRIRFANPGAPTIYIDDVAINSSATTPPPSGDLSAYYVSPTGNDLNSGTISAPFKTVTKAVSVAGVGDSIILRGGRHLYTATISISKIGTAAAKYYLVAYPGEKPILDFSGMAVSSSNRGVSLSGQYWHFKGIDFYGAGDNGMFMSGSNNIIELCNFYENHDTGLQIGTGASNNLILNCDSYYNEDPTQGNADGFAPKLDVGTGNIFRGCRAWQNSDDGWDGLLNSNFGQNPSTRYENCWCFMNGYTKSGALTSGNGNGFKMGGNLERHDATLTNCLSAFNKAKGFDQNNNAGSMILYNCTGYKNGGPAGKGNFGMNNNDPANGEVMIVKNSVSYLGGTSDVFRAVAQLTANSWQDGHVVTDADFAAVDSIGLRGPRKADGSLPDINFMHLASGSDLIDAGVSVGLSFNGAAPDLGCFETGGAFIARMRPSAAEQMDKPDAQLQVWPNIVTGESSVRFVLPSAGTVRVSLIDASGREIRQLWQGRVACRQLYQASLKRAGLAAGVYTVQVLHDMGRQLVRVVIP
jgi:hypothetical protein